MGRRLRASTGPLHRDEGEFSLRRGVTLILPPFFRRIDQSARNLVSGPKPEFSSRWRAPGSIGGGPGGVWVRAI
jgi:hypothetical protein